MQYISLMQYKHEPNNSYYWTFWI